MEGEGKGWWERMVRDEGSEWGEGWRGKREGVGWGDG